MRQIIYCPACHHRLFDADLYSRGSIEIKCPRCRQVQHIILYLTGYNEKLNHKKTTT